jgi:hypothetical protein
LAVIDNSRCNRNRCSRCCCSRVVVALVVVAVPVAARWWWRIEYVIAHAHVH